MKLYVKNATNTSSIPAKPVFAAEDEEAPTLSDKLGQTKADFELLVDQLVYKDDAEAEEIASRLQASVTDYIEEIADAISEGQSEEA